MFLKWRSLRLVIISLSFLSWPRRGCLLRQQGEAIKAHWSLSIVAPVTGAPTSTQSPMPKRFLAIAGLLTMKCTRLLLTYSRLFRQWLAFGLCVSRGESLPQPGRPPKAEIPVILCSPCSVLDSWCVGRFVEMDRLAFAVARLGRFGIPLSAAARWRGDQRIARISVDGTCPGLYDIYATTGIES